MIRFNGKMRIVEFFPPFNILLQSIFFQLVGNVLPCFDLTISAILTTLLTNKRDSELFRIDYIEDIGSNLMESGALLEAV